MALGRIHVWERDGRYYWRVRLPCSLAPRLGRAVIAWSLATRDPREARRRAARATAAFETFAQMLDRVPERRQPTDAEMMEVLRAIYDEIVLGRESVGAAVLSLAERAEEGIADEPLTPEEIALLERDHAEDSAEAWARALADNDLRRVEPWVQRHLVARGLATPEPFHLHRTLLRMALRVTDLSTGTSIGRHDIGAVVAPGHGAPRGALAAGIAALAAARNRAPEVRLIGDAASPRSALEAMFEGHEAGRAA